MDPAADKIFETPELHFLAIEHQAALFVPMDRDSYHRSIFLDRRVAALSTAPQRMALAPLVDTATAHAIPPTGWIFHVAHCGSTLLSRIVDNPGHSLVLREPLPLRQLGLAAAGGGGDGFSSCDLRLAYAMAGRRFAASEPAIVKANVPVNVILQDVLSIDPDAPAILLYMAFEPYLLAILRSEIHRQWVDRITRSLAPFLADTAALAPTAGVAERAAALWLAQIRAYDAALSRFAGCRSLDAETLFALPVETALAAASHFGVTPLDSAQVRSIAGTYSKDPSRPFDDQARRARQVEGLRLLGPELEIARAWLAAATVGREAPARLSRPLIGEPAMLMR